jgi:hypothetical protein
VDRHKQSHSPHGQRNSKTDSLWCGDVIHQVWRGDGIKFSQLQRPQAECNRVWKPNAAPAETVSQSFLTYLAMGG